VTESDEPVRHRKPLRRTAWTLLIGGVVALVLMVGVGLLILADGKDIEPGRPVVWPAGEQGAMYEHPGLHEGGPVNTPGCAVLGLDGKPTGQWLDWRESVRLSTGSSVQCEEEAIFLTGTASAVVSAVQGRWFGAPITAMVVGLLLFFPRFTLAWARLSNGRFLRR
jgi:hypothetical protein